jgi:ribosomal protein L12E/L44/L45/RPP1/RPP2
MRKKLTAALAAAAIATVGASGAFAQAAPQEENETGVATETQERHSEGRDNDFPWDLLGLLGLAGLLGLRQRGHDVDHRTRT